MAVAMSRSVLALCAIIAVLGCSERRTPPSNDGGADLAESPARRFTEGEIGLLTSLSLASLTPPPTSASNRVADSEEAARLGHLLFFDPGLSRNGRVSCATCHVPGLLFTDGLPTSRGIGQAGRNAPTLVGAAHSSWQFWDGRRDSLWSQALAPIEAGVEMGSTRLAAVHYVLGDPALRELYVQVFGAAPMLDDRSRFPDRAGPFGDREEREAWNRMAQRDREIVDIAFANVGKAIEAYERRLMPGPSRFDRFVDGLREDPAPGPGAPLDEQEIIGLRLFIDSGRTLCLRCHNGPLLTNNVFHDVGTGIGDGRLPDFGRYLGLQAVLIDPFNCLGRYSDAKAQDCEELRFIEKRHADGEMGKFKTPTLRGLPRTGPYMHDGRFATLREVIDHYRSPPVGPDPLEITPLELEESEVDALVAFLESLDGGIDADTVWLGPPPRSD